MKKEPRYISGILTLVSMIAFFLPIVKFGGKGISLIGIVTGSGKSSGFESILGKSSVAGYTALISFLVVFTVLSGVILMISKSKISYSSAIGEQIAEAILLVLIYVRIKEKISFVKGAAGFLGMGSSVGMRIFPLLLWFILQIICFVMNIRGIQEKESTPHLGYIDDIPNKGVPITPVKPWEEPPFTVPQQEKPFYGALAGFGGSYDGQMYPLREQEKIYLRCEKNEIIVQDNLGSSGNLGSIYYVPKYEEYCVMPYKSNTICLESGQPLGKKRLYYIPRGMNIIVRDGKAEEWFELA